MKNHQWHTARQPDVNWRNDWQLAAINSGHRCAGVEEVPFGGDKPQSSAYMIKMSGLCALTLSVRRCVGEVGAHRDIRLGAPETSSLPPCNVCCHS